MRSTGTLLTGASCLAVGVGIGWMVRPDAKDVFPARVEGISARTERDEILQKLTEIRLAIEMLQNQPAQSTAQPARKADTQASRVPDDGDLRAHLDARFDEVLSEVRRGLAGIDELSHLKPTPDLKALALLRGEFDANRKAGQDHVSGMSFRDAIRLLGTPTHKLMNDRIRGPNGAKVTSWIWEAPESNSEFMLQFENGVAFWGQFGALGVLTKFATDAGK